MMVSRPKNFSDFVGQKELIDNLRVYIKAACNRKESLDHCLLHGPAGLGKTSLAHVIAIEMSVEIVSISALSIEHVGDMIAIASDLKPLSVLFIDEIHRLSKPLQETLYTIMEDFMIDIVIGNNEDARTVRLELEPFTLIGATTDLSFLSHPFMERFGIHCVLNYYDDVDIQEIIVRNARLEMCKITQDGIIELSLRSRGIPRLAKRYFKRIKDFAVVEQIDVLDGDLVTYALNQMGIDHLGLNDFDKQYLKVLDEQFSGGPVGVSSIASVLSVDAHTLETIYEPYLLKLGLIQRTPSGRVLSEIGMKHINNLNILLGD